jgi:hypothetical protein
LKKNNMRNRMANMFTQQRHERGGPDIDGGPDIAGGPDIDAGILNKEQNAMQVGKYMSTTAKTQIGPRTGV